MTMKKAAPIVVLAIIALILPVFLRTGFEVDIAVRVCCLHSSASHGI